MTTKNEITRSLVLKVNLHASVFYWIKFNLWNGTTIKQSFEKTLNHYKEDTQGITLDITMDEVKKRMISYVLSLETSAGLDKMIKEEKISCIKPSFAELMEDSQLPFKNKKELQNFIIKNVIPEVAGDKIKHAIQCTAENGQIGDFAYIGTYPSDYKRITPVFTDLAEFFTYSRNNGIRV